MTKEITKAVVLQEIHDKFKLREFDPAPFLFNETVIPVYNIEPHLETLKNDYIQKSVTGTGALAILTVPDTERWTLYRYDVVFMGAGAYTVAGVYTRRGSDPDYFCYMDLTAGQTVSYHINLPVPVVLRPHDYIRVNIDGYTSTQNIRLYMDYKVEELR